MAKLEIKKNFGKKQPVEVTFVVYNDDKAQTRGAEITKEELAKALAKKMGSPVSLMTNAALLKAIIIGLDEVEREMKLDVQKVL
jgi:hypothetical protein